MNSSNRVHISAAGSGKTTLLVKEALKSTDSVLLTTYTIQNTQEIFSKIVEINKIVPKNIEVFSWFSFLLHDCVRPYQKIFHETLAIDGIAFVQGRSQKFISKDRIDYYVSNNDNIFSDKLSEFALKCNELSGGKVIDRIKRIYRKIFIDEIQDMSGFDLELIEVLFCSGIEIVLVGDPRQGTYSTNESAKNKKFRKSGIILKIDEWAKKGYCKEINETYCYRCNGKICDFTDKLYLEYPSVVSKNTTLTGHDGVFCIKSAEIESYIDRYSPIVLRYDRRTEWTLGRVLNYGIVKGKTFERVLIIPNGPLKKYLQTGNIASIAGSKEKIYVAMTRAQYSIAFIYDGICGISEIEMWDGK